MSKVHTNKPGYHGEGSVEVAPPAGPGEGPIRRSTLSKDGLVQRPFEGIDTVYDVVEYAARTHGNRKALGWRDVITVHEEEKEVKKIVDGKEVTEKKKWKYFELSDYKYISFIELKEAVSEVARGLVHLGVTKDDVFNVYAQTRYVLALLQPCKVLVFNPLIARIGNSWPMHAHPFLLLLPQRMTLLVKTVSLTP